MARLALAVEGALANSLAITNEQAANRATLMKTTLADALLRLVQNLIPNQTTNRTVLLANEANFTGYPAGGYNTTNWTGPALLQTGGAVITAPSQNVIPAANNVITNNLTGWWLETAGNSPLTLLTGIINPALVVLLPTDQFPLLVQDFEGLVPAPG